MVELNDAEKALVVDLVKIAWNAGAVRAPQQAQQLDALLRKLLPAGGEEKIFQKKEKAPDGGKQRPG